MFLLRSSWFGLSIPFQCTLTSLLQFQSAWKKHKYLVSEPGFFDQFLTSQFSNAKTSSFEFFLELWNLFTKISIFWLIVSTSLAQSIKVIYHTDERHEFTNFEKKKSNLVRISSLLLINKSRHDPERDLITRSTTWWLYLSPSSYIDQHRFLFVCWAQLKWPSALNTDPAKRVL